ncbi:MAG: hypothetical protein JKY09_01595 [Crocinitomicaceae bacterium]|nr:hypothetical protein [Crocinitomicaceae bacterium]
MTFNGTADACLTCTSTTHWLDTTGDVNTCAAVTAVDNCIDYNTATGNCAECERSGYYLNGAVCSAPGTAIEGCA